VPRPPRVFQPGVSLHAYQRGHNCSAIFHEREDYQQFLNSLRWAAAENDVDIHAFALMTNHYHLLATPHAETTFPRAMKQLDGGYGRYSNRKHGRRGTIWCGRYDAKPLLDERYFWTCFTYIERNPVEAGIVAAAEDYPWTSYRAHAWGEQIRWLTPHPLYIALGETAVERQAAYQAIFSRCPMVSDTIGH
jgi:putative transposase